MDCFCFLSRHCFVFVLFKQNKTNKTIRKNKTISNTEPIDLNQRLSCDHKVPAGVRTRWYLRAAGGTHPLEKAEFVGIGQPETGFAVQSVSASKNTYTLPDGTKKQIDSKTEVMGTQMEEGSLDAALFEIPPGFKHVEHIERSPRPSASSSQAANFWQRFKGGVTRLFSR